jgi:cell division protein FtsQ
MPVDMDDPDDEGSTDRARFRKLSDAPVRSWWRPTSSMGRVFLGLGALAVVSVFAVSAFALKTFLERDSRFRIASTSNIQATGLAEVSRSEMLPVFGEDVGRNIFFVPLSERRRQLEAIPWIEHATVMRLLPDQIRVAVVERQPIAFLRQGQHIGLVDRGGVLLSMPAALMSQRHYSFPVVTGIDGRDPLPARKNRMGMYSRLLGELDANGQHYSDQISEIDLTDPEDARVLMPEQGTDILAHFGEDHFLERYQRYKAHIGEWRQQYPKLAEVDLRYEQQVVLQMTPGANATPTAVSTGEGKTEATDIPKSAENQKPVVRPQATKTDAPKHAQATHPVKAHVVAKSSHAKPINKSKTAKNKAVPKKKNSQPSKAALSTSKQKPPPKNHSAAVSGLGQ